MTITKDMHRKITKKVQTYGDKVNAYGDSYSQPLEHQPDRNEMFMDRDMWILHQDLKKIIALLEKK